jgi:CubicO group peptidase (beta-lactamase class C family)
VSAAWDEGGVERLRRVLDGHVERGGVPGLAWLVARHGEVRTGVAGTLTADDPAATPVPRDGIFRIASISKPITAVAALILLEECRLRLVAAERPVTVRDVLTFRMGLGMDFSAPFPQPTLDAMSALGLGDGPPAPAGPPAPDEWMRRLGTLPLSHQPGSRWLYDTSAEVLGVLVARAAEQPFERFLAERVFGPLGMVDTAFSVAPADLGRFAGCYGTVGDDGGHAVYDAPDGQWSRPPAFPSGAGGLVSTVDDLLAFGAMLLTGGTHLGERILTRPTIEAMTTNQLTPEQLATAAPSPDAALGWGLGVGVQVRRVGPTRPVGAYGWDGGLGSSWANDPSEGLVGILLTNQMWTSPSAPAVCRDFWTCTYAAFAD